MTTKIHEIFRSIQGEGPYAGVEQVFVRFYGCNMTCGWCDTPAAIGNKPGPFQEMTVDEIMRAVDGLWRNGHSVSLTGGEPLVQPESVRVLAGMLQEKGRKVYLETNGVLPEALADVVDQVDVIAMDIKLPSSTGCRPYWGEHRAFLRIARERETFIKIVVSSKTVPADIERAVELITRIDDQLEVIIQPNSFELNNGVMKGALSYYDYCRKYLPKTRLLPQIHRFMKLR